MPMLSVLFVSIYNGLVNFAVTWFSKKLAVGIAAVATFASLTSILWAAVSLALNIVVAVVPSDSGILMGLWVACPDNLIPCLSATLTADAAIFVYRWNAENLRLMAYVT